MTEFFSLAKLRQFSPVLIFAIVIIGLIFSALTTVSDIMTLRSTLKAETELLAKIKDRVSRKDGTASLDIHAYLIDASSQGVAMGELQRLVSDIVNAAGADLQLKDVMPAEPDGDAGRLAIAINFEIEDDRLPDLLYGLENAKPALLIERLSLRILTNAQSSTARRLQGTATLVAAWRAPT